MAQPWTESAPVDFGKFAESAQDGASNAQNLLAATSKNFSDLLTNNIDKVNLAKNTLHATELLNSLNVDASKQLFRSGDVMNSITEMLGTNNIDFKNEKLTTALGEAQKRIHDNDHAIMKDAITTKGNEYMLNEDPNMLKARFDSTLSISDIIAIRQEGINKNTERKLFDMSMDSKNLGKSATMIKYQMLQENPGTINPDKLDEPSIIKAMTAGSDAQYNAFDSNYNGYIAGVANGNNMTVSRDMLDQKITMNNATGHSDRNDQDTAIFVSSLESNLVKSGKNFEAESITAKYKEKLKDAEQAIVADVNTYAKGGEYVMGSIVADTIKHGNIALNDYAKMNMGNKEANLFLTAYEQYNGLGLTPAGFHALLKRCVDDLRQYSDPRDLISDLENRKPFQAVKSNSTAISERIKDGIVRYRATASALNEKKIDDLINAVNGAPTSFDNALNGPSGSNPTAQAWSGKDKQLAELESSLQTPVNSDAYRSSYTDFGLQQKYSSDPTVAYADNMATQLSSWVPGGVAGWLLGKLLPKKLQNFTTLPLIAGGGFGTNQAFNLALNSQYGNRRYAFDDARIIPDLQAIKKRFINNTYTAEDVATVKKLSSIAGSLSQKARNELNSVRTVRNQISQALK